MADFLTVVFTGLSSGLAAACVNQLFTSKLVGEHDRREFEISRCQRIETLRELLEEVKINYGRKHRVGSYLDEGFVVKGETLTLTFVKKNLDLYGSFLSEPFDDLLQEQFDIACELAQAIPQDEPTWDAVIAKWNVVSMKLSDAMASGFYKKGIRSPSSQTNPSSKQLSASLRLP